jgi:class 3 adenylate cyclase
MGKENNSASHPVSLKIEIPSPPPGCPNIVHVDKETVTVGRSEKNDIVIPNSRVSREHMRLTFTDRVLYIEDLNSKNGTFVRVGDSWKKIKDIQHIPLPASLMLGTLVMRLDILQPATLLEKQKDLLNSMIAAADKKFNDQEKFQAIMVLDLCDSSKLANTDEEMAFHLKMRLDSIAKRILDKTEVNFYKSTGDGFIATFNLVVNALNAALSLLEVLKTRNQRTPNPPIDIRIALHAGKIHIFGDATKDIHGTNVDITFRIEHVKPEAFSPLKTTLPAKNRILCSKKFIHELAMKGVHIKALTCCGKAKLKGIENPIEVYLVPLS